MLIGAHVSIAGGLWNAPGNAAAIGCNCFQFFTRSPQGGLAPPLTEELLQKFRAECARHRQQLWVVHTPYYINLASKEERIRFGSIRVIREDLERASLLNAKYLMTHLGSARDVGEKQGRELVIDGLLAILENYRGSAQFLIEISAGAGAIIGDTFEEIGEIIRGVEDRLTRSGAPPIDAMRRAGPRRSIGKEPTAWLRAMRRGRADVGDRRAPWPEAGGSGTRASSDRAPQGSPSPKGLLAREAGSARSQGEETARNWRGCQIGVCFDTQHAFASGYDLRTPDAVAATLKQFDQIIGFDRLKMSHINDSKVGLGEHKDRHEHIGRGQIGAAGLRAFVKNRALDKLPLILETEDDGREEDVRLLKEFLKT